MILFEIAFSFSAAIAQEDTGKFDFYYQQIEKVVQIESAKPPVSAWDYVKSYATKGLNLVKKYWESTVTRNVFPGQGTKLWYSEKDPKIAYQVRRVRVTSEKQLLQAMGVADSDTTKLTNGQKALLHMYRNAKDSTLKSLSKKAIFPRIVINLTDTTGFGDYSKYPNLKTDFWPTSYGLSITLPSWRFNFPNSETDAMTTFVHETAHCTNLTFKELKGYGPDGVHYSSELTKPRAAFQEAWSEYQELLFDPEMAKTWPNEFKTLMIEDPKIAGKYQYIDIKDPKISGMDLFSAEAVDAYLMYRMAKEIPDGRKKVEEAFGRTNFPWRSMPGLLKKFVSLYPADAKKVAEILDSTTVGKLSNQDMLKVLGNSPEVQSFVSSRKIEKAPAAVASLNPSKSASSGVFSDPRKDYDSAYKGYLEAVKKGVAQGVVEAKKRLDSASRKLKTAVNSR